jgi:DNA-binding NtrC family response regulator
MKNLTYKALILEDTQTDAELIERELKKSHLNFVVKHVKTELDFQQALQAFHPDIILSDYNLPDFNGLQALKIAKTELPEVPFIFITGALGDEKAIETLKKGAIDYVLKDRLIQLMPAIERALKDAAIAREFANKDAQINDLNQFMVDRELKMVDLKKMIAKLEKHKPT